MKMVTRMKNHEIMSASEKGVLPQGTPYGCARPASDELDRDVFCHDMIDGKLLQTNKKYSQLKQKQKDKIAVWMYEETRKYYERTGKYPIEHHDDEVVDAVYERITDADIWVPYGEVAKHYQGVRTKITRRIRREEAEKQHPPEKVIFMNMCMLCDGDQVLALDKTGSSYNGTTFPGGHVEAGETFSEAKVFEDYQEKYLADPKSGPCPCFHVGDTFLLKRTPERDDFYHLMDGKFCGEAWDAGVTRAKRILVLICEKKAISYAVRNETTTSRNTKLAERLRDATTAPAFNRQSVDMGQSLHSTGIQQSKRQIQNVAGNKVTYFPDQNVETLMVAEPPMQYGISNLFDRLAQLQKLPPAVSYACYGNSKFRSSFSLKANDRAYVKEKGMDTMRSHAQDFVSKRLASAEQQEYVVNVLMEWIERQMR